MLIIFLSGLDPRSGRYNCAAGKMKKWGLWNRLLHDSVYALKCSQMEWERHAFT